MILAAHPCSGHACRQPSRHPARRPSETPGLLPQLLLLVSGLAGEPPGLGGGAVLRLPVPKGLGLSWLVRAAVAPPCGWSAVWTLLLSLLARERGKTPRGGVQSPDRGGSRSRLRGWLYLDDSRDRGEDPVCRLLVEQTA